MVDRLWIEAILPGVDYREVEMRTQVREYYEKNIKLGELRYLRDVLDFEELYEAYPQLRHISVSFEKLSAGTNAQVVRSNGKDSIVLSESLLRYPERQMLSSLLHEVQHVIQGIEGFAQGGNEYSARIAANNKRRYPFTEWIDGKSDYELYQRLAGEIEARNVQARMNMAAEERAKKPFNETLEYPGEAITPITFSLSPTLRADIRRAAYNKMDAKEHVRLCTMPTVLRMLGEPEGDVYTLPSTISKLVYTHNLAHPEVYRAVEELEDPLFVFRDTEKSYLFVLEMQATNNKGEKSNVAVAIQLQRSESGHYLLSAYPLDALAKIKDLQNQGRLVYSKYTAQELEEAINKQAIPPTADAPSPFKPDLMRAAVKDGLSEIVMTKQDIVNYKRATEQKNVATFSIIGPKAKTWDKYKHRAFTGRDDRMQRAEIDASKAKVKAEALRGNGSEVLKSVVAGADAKTRAMVQRWRELDQQVQEGEAESVLEEYFAADVALHEQMQETLERCGVDMSMLSLYDVQSALTFKVMYAESVTEGEVNKELADAVDRLSVNAGVFTMDEVLDYAELYEAYPWLSKVQLHIMDVGTEIGGYTDGRSIVLAPYWVANPENLRSALLHELQHMVQFAEGFTTGDMPARMVENLQEELQYYEMALADLSKVETKTPSEAKVLAESIEVMRNRRDTMARMLEEHRANPHELYMRLAGEIEARNVQARMNMAAEERAKKPFNETLEYRGEAITPITFSLNGKEYFSDKNGNPVSFEELIERSRQGHEELFAELMKAATPEMREAVAKIEAVLSGKLDKSFRYRDLTAEEVEFFESRTGVDFSDYEWRIVPRALLHENKRADNKRGWPLTETELKLLPYFIDSMMQNKETLAVSLGNVNAKGVRSLIVELENPITNTKLVFEASSKKHKRRPTKTKEAPRLSLSSAKMLLIQRAGLAPASTHKSVPSGDFNVAENAGEVKQNLLKQEFSSKDTSINSTKAPAVFGAVEDKLGGWQKGTVNVDIGGGKFDTLTQKLAEKGVTNYIYEPFGRSINANAYILAQLQARKNLGDTATCSNVLNVIKEAEIRANVVHQVAKAIKPDGVAYFTIYEGDKTGRGKKTKDDCWQNNRKTVTYVEEVKQFFGDVVLKGGVIVARAPLYVNEPAVWKLGSESETDFVTFSLSSTEAEGLFEDGVMMADNAVVTEPGVSFSIEALHASPHNFRKFSTDKMGTGEGHQVYGWGLYFATSTGVNRAYFKQFRRAMQYDYAYRINGERVSEEQALAMIPGLSETAHPSNLLDALKSREVTRSFVPVVKETIKEWKSYRASREAVRKSYVEYLPKDEERLERNIAKLSDRTKKKKRKEHEENVARMLRGFDEDISRLSADLEALEKVLEWAKAGNKLEYKRGGLVHNYRVELNVEDSNLLDWDKACVTPELREGLKELGISDKAGEFDFRSSTGQYVYRELESHFESKKAASEWLAARGYKGIKYLDGLSRKKGKGTYNYVVFSGADVKITAIQSREEWAPRAGWKKYEDETATFSLGMTAEMADIKAAAEAAGTFMKAPNGKPSNLNAVQWMQVRTKAFKRWFGDWENAPANASRVVDENGEPLVVYHGARHAGFRVFDNEEGERRSDAPDGTSFFSSSYEVAATYTAERRDPDLLDESLQEEIEEYGIEDFAGGIYPVFLNIREPYTINFKDRGWQDDRAFYTLQDETGDYIQPLNGDEYYDSEDEARERAEALGLEEYEIYPEYKDTNSVTQEALDMGADGAIIENVIDEGSYGYGSISATDYVIFDSTQVKSATQNRGAFDGENADITFSIIGPRALTWDRYADQAFKGRDDGKLRAEIDSGRARVKDGVFGFDKVKVYRQLIADWGQLPEDERFAVLNYVDLHDEYRSARIAWRDSGGAEEAEAAMRVKRDAAEAAKPAAVAAMEAWFAPRGVRLGEEISDNDTMVKLAESFWYGNADSVVERALISRDNTARLGDVLDYAELYEAYPQLAEMDVEVRDLGGSYLGRVQGYGRSYELIAMDEKLLGDWGRFRSVLLHELQHVVQRIEGYAKGGNKESVYQHVKDVMEFNDWQMRMLGRELRWLSGLDSAKDYLRSARRLLKYPNAWKYNGLRYRHWSAALDGSDVARLMVDDIAGMYAELRAVDNVETERRNHVIREEDYALPEVDFSDVASIERGLDALGKLKPRRSAFRGEAPKKDKRYVELMRYVSATNRMLDKYKLEPYELYVRLAGEIEARNVQARMDMTAAERLTKPFNETLEYPGEALVTFSLSAVKAPFVASAQEAKSILSKARGKIYKNGDVSAIVSSQTLGKTYAAQMSVRNLMALGYSEEEARQIHYSASTKIHEIFEAAEYGFFEENYDAAKKKGREGAWHYLGVVDVEGYGEFDVNVSAIKPTRKQEDNKLFTLELTIENPSEIGSDSLSRRGRALRSEGFSEHRLAAYRSFVEKEMNAIKKNAEHSGTFMKAPNGKKSNLNEKQWLQVRTKAFKAWFGDWENDPANASKVVDENGEPMVVYHGTRSAFTVFDRAEGGQSNKYAQVGFWFSPIKGFGERFAWNAWWGDGEAREMDVFLNMRNPKVFEGHKGEPYGDAYEQFRTDVVALLGKDAEFANIGGLGMAWHKGYNKMGVPNYMTSAEQRAVIDEYREKLKAEGYDGIVIKQTEYDYSTAGSANDQYVVLESAQAKSATDNRGTFDGGNADITYSLSGPSILDAAPTGRMAVEEKMQRLLNYARKEAARWGRTFSKETPNAKAAEAMGTVSSLLASIHKELPPMYRPRVESHLRYVEVYARLIESGKIRTYGKLSKEQRAEVEAELMEVLREEQQRVDAEYEQAKAEALQAAALTGEMAAAEAAAEMDVEDEVKRAAYLERVAKRAEAEARKRLLAEAEAKKQQLDAEVESLKREFGAEKLGAIAKRMLTDAANSVERYLIDEELATVPKLLERLAPKKLPNGKYDKGRMSADGYRKFVRYVEMIEADAETVAERMEALGLQIAAEEAKSDAEGNADKLDALQAELAEWSTYGNLRGKQLEAVRAGVRALADFAAYEKNAWQSVQKLKRERVKRQALTAAEALGGASEHKVKAVKDKERRLVSMLGNLGASMKSLAQMFYSMGGVPELRALADESVDALAAGHVALTLREKRAYEQLAEFMKDAMGLDTENKRNDWMVALKKLHDTGICKAGELVRHRLKLTPEDAAVWLSMTKAERDAKRAELGAEADKQGVLVENVPYEEDMPLLRDALDAYNEKPEGKKWVHTEREFRRPAPTETMKLSKDEALNILLLCEQKDYIEAADENGYTDEVLDQLREFVGNEVLGFGYAMREVLENNGLAEVYEAREGVPFPKVANYWPGNFDQSARANEQANALDPTSGNGTRYGMLITRVKHKLRFNILGASNVFMAALAQQNNYIVVGELTAKWRGLLSHSDFAMSLRQYMGDAEFRQLKELINLLDGAGVQESITQQTLSGLMGQMQSAHAMAVLAGSPVTLVKQVSAMLNAGVWQGVSMLRVLSRIVLDRFEKGAIRYADMLKKDYFQARYRDNRYFTEMLQLGNDANWSRLSKWARMAMRGIEAMDVLANCAGMTALYNITYEDLTQRNEGAVDPLTETEIHAECDRAVRNALELGAQPLRRTQKSAFAALSRNALVRMTCYMSSEAINKLGMTMAIRRRTGGGANGVFKAWKYLAGISLAQQIVVMCLDMARGAAPNDDDEWVEWLLLNLATGASGLGVLQSIPLVGEAVQKMTGGYVKTGSLGQMVYDFEGAWRSGKKVVGMAGDDKEESWQDWAWAIGNLFRHMTFTTGLWKGVNASFLSLAVPTLMLVDFTT